MKTAVPAVALLVLSGGSPGLAVAQSPESDVTAESAHLVQDDSAYAVPPIVSDRSLEALQYEDHKDRFSTKAGIVLLPMDYTSFDQDAAGKQQVGNQRVLDQRATWTVGWYNDWWVEGRSWSDSGNNFAGRVTTLPVWSEDGKTYLHLGAALRYYGAVEDQLRYKGKPASNVAGDFVDTGKIPGDHAWHSGLEALLNVRSWSLLAEYVRADLSTDDDADPTFDGCYLTAGWVVTREHRPYDRKAGYARRILPQGRWGAVELIARYARVDLDDRSVSGGVMDGWWAGVNWWASRRFRASVGYGDIDLERFGLEGNTRTLLTRLQWIY